jgi:hypothetical protein
MSGYPCDPTRQRRVWNPGQYNLNTNPQFQHLRRKERQEKEQRKMEKSAKERNDTNYIKNEGKKNNRIKKINIGREGTKERKERI